LQAQESHATAEKVMTAASALFAEKGYANVSIRDICKATGTTAPVIYYYFGSKKGLFDAVARKQISMGDFVARLSKFSEAPDPKRGIESLIASYLSYFPEHSFDAGLYMRDSATLDKHSARIVSDDLERISKIVTALIERSIAKGQFRKTDPEMASDCLLGMLNRVIFQHIHFAKSSDRDSYRRFVTEFFFRAME
jgi:TetR/AcrR family transcriptional regulator